MALHPKYRRYFWQAFSFGVIWAVFGLIYVLIEKGILGESDIYPATLNKYDFFNALIYTPSGSFIMGFILGWVEVVWVKKLFLNRPFWLKILFKGTFYLIMIILFLVLLTLTINSIRYNTSPFHPDVIASLAQFMNKFAFWSIVIYTGVMIDVALFFSEVRDFLGSSIYYNYSFGTYHKPKKENRIFMFLDMKGSTSIAEKMGHSKYFELIKTYYADMTDAILESSGEIYQYVGDEIVVTWPESIGLARNNCLHCYLKIRESIDKNKEHYQNQYGFVPDFKAGFHVGEVTIGEIGTLKKDIIYTGDVLNATARIQGLCNSYEAPILISETLRYQLNSDKNLQFSEIGSTILRGKVKPMPLYRVEFT